MVLARDEVTGETAYKPITALIAGEEKAIWEVTVESIDADGAIRRETIGTTFDHPWRLVGGDWRETAELEPGDQLVSADGRRAVVVTATETERVEMTYNFEVEDFHTYFVGENGLWVHNACIPLLKLNRFPATMQDLVTNALARADWPRGEYLEKFHQSVTARHLS